MASTRLMPVMSSSTPPKATDSPSVVRPPPRTVTGTRMLLRRAAAARAICAALRAMHHAVRQAVGGAAGVGGEGAARRERFAQFDAARAQRRGELRPVRAVPARRVGLLALDALQRIGGDRAGADGAGFYDRDVHLCPCVRKSWQLRRYRPSRCHMVDTSPAWFMV